MLQLKSTALVGTVPPEAASVPVCPLNASQLGTPEQLLLIIGLAEADRDFACVGRNEPEVDDTCSVKGAVPPLTRTALYGELIVAVVEAAAAGTVGLATTLMEKDCEPVAVVFAASVTWTVKFCAEAVAAEPIVPEIDPSVPRLRPAGNDPELTVQPA